MKAPRWRLAAASALLAAGALAPGWALADQGTPSAPKAASPAPKAAPVAAPPAAEAPLPAAEAPPPVAPDAAEDKMAAEPTPAASSTPLNLRGAGGLSLGSPVAPTSRPWLSNLFLVALAGGAGFFFWKRKGFVGKRAPGAPATMRVIGRLPLGGRGEAVMVEIEGRRMLLGVTAQTVQHLADIDDESGAPAAALASKDAGREPFADMLRAARAAKAVELRERGDEPVRAEADERPRPAAARRATTPPAVEPAEPAEPRAIERQVLGLRRRGQES